MAHYSNSGWLPMSHQGHHSLGLLKVSYGGQYHPMPLCIRWYVEGLMAIDNPNVGIMVAK